MYRAITLIELLTTLTVIAIVFYFFLPIIFHLPDPILLNNEIDQIKSFIYQIQSKARYRKQNYSIIVTQNKADNKWCIVAIAKKGKKQTACNCLNIKSCRIDTEYFLYQPLSNKINLKSNGLYPKVFSDIDGKTGQFAEKCLGLKLNNSEEILQLDTNGVINVVPKNKRSKCR